MLDLETHLKFDRQILTEVRFRFRNWLENWCAALSNLNRQGEWTHGLLATTTITGLTQDILDINGFCEYAQKQHELGGWQVRVPRGKIKFIMDNKWQLRGEIECYTSGVLSFAGGIVAEIEIHDSEFVLVSITLEPRLRVEG